MTLLSVNDLSVTIRTAHGPVEIINRLGFEMQPGEKLGIVGESGCGKSITALAIMSLLPAGSVIKGSIDFKGQELSGLSQKRYDTIRGNRIGMIFQEPMTALNPVKTIGNQIAESLLLHKKNSRKDALERTTELMENVGLPVKRFPLNLYPHQLSGGQRQRVMIAMAIACGPDLLIADEPTTALDVTVQEQILDLIVDLAEKSHMGLIMISHDLGVIAQTADQVLVMYMGNSVERGGTVDVFQKMKHPYTYGLFSAIPKRAGKKNDKRERLSAIPGQVPDIHLKTDHCDFAERCSRAREICFQNDPPETRAGNNHWICCFNPREDGGV